MSRVREIAQLLISPCPSPAILRKVLKSGVVLILNLEPTCRDYYREVRGKAVVLEYPLQPLSIKPVEEVNELVRNILQVIKSGGKVLIHGGNNIDDRCLTVAKMILVARGEKLEGVEGPQSLVQELAVSWYARLTDLIGVEELHVLYEIGRRYDFGAGLEHASTVANISLDMAFALKSKLELSREDLVAAYVSGLFHDVGRFYSERRHEETGVEILRTHAKALRDLVDMDLVEFCVKHHRRHTKPHEDPLLERVGDKGLHLAAILRLADSFTSVYSKEEYWGVHLEDDSLVVVARFVNKHRFSEKGKLLEKVLNIRPLVRSS